MSVLGIETRVSLVVEVQQRRLDVVAATPEVYLLVSVFQSSLSFVKTLESTVVALIKSPMLVVLDPVEIKL